MTTLFIVLVIGAVAGFVAGFLMRDRHPQSRWITVAGIVGAALAAGLRAVIQAPGLVVVLATALAGALLLSFAVRVSMFAHES